MKILKNLLFNLLTIKLLLINCRGNKYRSNLDQFTKIFHHQTNEIEIYFSKNSSVKKDKIIKNTNNLNNDFEINRNKKQTFIQLGTEPFFCNTGESANLIDNPEEYRDISWEKIDDKTKDYLKKSKIAWILERCFNYTVRKELSHFLQIQVDIYEICIGISIRHKKVLLEKNTEMVIVEGQFNLIGEYLPNRDIFEEDGRITQFYGPSIYKLKDNARYTVSIQFKCSYNYSGIKNLREEKDIDTETIIIIDYEAPSFCDWRIDQYVNNTSIKNINSLLIPLENKCQNYTDSQFWSYELCNFYSVTQFKKGNQDSFLKLFILGVNPNITHINKNTNLKDYLNFNLLSNLIVNKKINNNFLSSDINVNIEPRNVNEILFQNSVYDKYVLVVNLTNGTFCKEINQERSIKLVFECPDFFEKYSSNYFKIVNIVENSICKYEMLIHTSVICCHPLLMPQPKLNKKNIECYRKSNPNNYFDLIKKGYNEFELISSDYINLINTNKTNNSYFSTSNKPRFRKNNHTDPSFQIGQIVQHKKWKYYGVIIGWDWNLLAPISWSNYIYQKYSHNYKEKPHYLLLIHQEKSLFSDDQSTSIPLNFTHTYLPEIALNYVEINSSQTFSYKEVIVNQYLNSYFSYWSFKNLRFVPATNSTLWKLYPDDLKQIIEKDEL